MPPLPPIDTFLYLNLVCTECEWQKKVFKEQLTEEAKEYFNNRSIGWLFNDFKCKQCDSEFINYFDKEDNPVLGGEYPTVCGLGGHQIPIMQLQANPARQNCIHCQEEAHTENTEPLIPQLINGGPCQQCISKRLEDPVRFAHRIGRLEYHKGTDGLERIRCSLNVFMQPNSCSFFRYRTTDDNIREVRLDNPYFDIFLEDVTQELEHRGDPIPDAIIEPETNPEPEVIENIDEELEIFSLKLEELNEAFHRLKEKIDNP
mgnify:CR=1 FL=1